MANRTITGFESHFHGSPTREVNQAARRGNSVLYRDAITAADGLNLHNTDVARLNASKITHIRTNLLGLQIVLAAGTAPTQTVWRVYYYDPLDDKWYTPTNTVTVDHTTHPLPVVLALDTFGGADLAIMLESVTGGAGWDLTTRVKET